MYLERNQSVCVGGGGRGMWKGRGKSSQVSEAFVGAQDPKPNRASRQGCEKTEE